MASGRALPHRLKGDRKTPVACRKAMMGVGSNVRGDAKRAGSLRVRSTAEPRRAEAPATSKTHGVTSDSAGACGSHVCRSMTSALAGAP